ncbi:hypothetical protein BJD20_17895 [Acinetobacter proteolyticus]|uniref:hypothetical protein n=1 Tax=Acinetobacter proteolyticus TaxID=1776741 RepID=UPI000863301D|nr:hypothetical protein [Acinetobacter proteolyticus]OEY94942.1 hypothetical protein BJD20_17895 [Acinetobacter proteolyticus]
MSISKGDSVLDYYAKVDAFWGSVNIADENKLTYLMDMFERGVQQSDADMLEFVADLAFKIENQEIRVSALNQLLLLDGHYQHQMITKELQNIAHPSSVAIVAKVLEQSFKRFEYTASADGVIAKWFSHALADIGTEEAMALLKLYAQSENEEIAQEMKYRLRRIADKQDDSLINRPKMNVFKKLVSAFKK